jgi:hypothetical protein
MKYLTLTALLLLTACGTKSPSIEYVEGDSARYEAINRRTVNFLDRSEESLKPCLDIVNNKYATDLSIAAQCQQAVLLYRKYGGRPHLEPLYLTLMKDSDKIRSNQLVNNLDMIDAKFSEIEKRNEDNFYFTQVMRTQEFAQKAADVASTKVEGAKEVQ